MVQSRSFLRYRLYSDLTYDLCAAVNGEGRAEDMVGDDSRVVKRTRCKSAQSLARRFSSKRRIYSHGRRIGRYSHGSVSAYYAWGENRKRERLWYAGSRSVCVCVCLCFLLAPLPPSPSMNYLRGAVSAISAPYQYYKDINPSTLTGAIDVIVIRRPKLADGSTSDNQPPPGPNEETEFACSPFHVRFGKWQVLRPADKKVRNHQHASYHN